MRDRIWGLIGLGLAISAGMLAYTCWAALQPWAPPSWLLAAG